MVTLEDIISYCPLDIIEGLEAFLYLIRDFTYLEGISDISIITNSSFNNLRNQNKLRIEIKFRYYGTELFFRDRRPWLFGVCLFEGVPFMVIRNVRSEEEELDEYPREFIVNKEVYRQCINYLFTFFRDDPNVRVLELGIREFNGTIRDRLGILSRIEGVEERLLEWERTYFWTEYNYRPLIGPGDCTLDNSELVEGGYCPYNFQVNITGSINVIGSITIGGDTVSLGPDNILGEGDPSLLITFTPILPIEVIGGSLFIDGEEVEFTTLVIENGIIIVDGEPIPLGVEVFISEGTLVYEEEINEELVTIELTIVSIDRNVEGDVSISVVIPLEGSINENGDVVLDAGPIIDLDLLIDNGEETFIVDVTVVLNEEPLEVLFPGNIIIDLDNGDLVNRDVNLEEVLLVGNDKDKVIINDGFLGENTEENPNDFIDVSLGNPLIRLASYCPLDKNNLEVFGGLAEAFYCIAKVVRAAFYCPTTRLEIEKFNGGEEELLGSYCPISKEEFREVAESFYCPLDIFNELNTIEDSFYCPIDKTLEFKVAEELSYCFIEERRLREYKYCNVLSPYINVSNACVDVTLEVNPQPQRLNFKDYCLTLNPRGVNVVDYCTTLNPRGVNVVDYCLTLNPRGVNIADACISLIRPAGRGPNVANFCNLPNPRGLNIVLYCTSEDPRRPIEKSFCSIPTVLNGDSVKNYCEGINPRLLSSNEVSYCDIDLDRSRLNEVDFCESLNPR